MIVRPHSCMGSVSLLGHAHRWYPKQRASGGRHTCMLSYRSSSIAMCHSQDMLYDLPVRG